MTDHAEEIAAAKKEHTIQQYHRNQIGQSLVDAGKATALTDTLLQITIHEVPKLSPEQILNFIEMCLTYTGQSLGALQSARARASAMTRAKTEPSG